MSNSRPCCSLLLYFFFFNDTATTEIYTLSLHDALPIWRESSLVTRSGDDFSLHYRSACPATRAYPRSTAAQTASGSSRSEEHTSELQSRQYLVCRLLLEKKKIQNKTSQSQLTPTHPARS